MNSEKRSFIIKVIILNLTLKCFFLKTKVFISTEQYLSIKIKHWRTIYFKPEKAHLSAIFLVCIFIFVNSHILITFGHSEVLNNSTHIEFCYKSNFIPFIPVSTRVQDFFTLFLQINYKHKVHKFL